jgi:hypothetical protein
MELKRFKDFIFENSNLKKSASGLSKFGVDTGFGNWAVLLSKNNHLDLKPFNNEKGAIKYAKSLLENDKDIQKCESVQEYDKHFYRCYGSKLEEEVGIKLINLNKENFISIAFINNIHSDKSDVTSPPSKFHDKFYYTIDNYDDNRVKIYFYYDEPKKYDGILEYDFLKENDNLNRSIKGLSKFGMKKIKVITYGGKEIIFTQDEIQEMIDDIDTFWYADNLPKWLYSTGLAKDQKDVIEKLKKILHSANDVTIDVDSKKLPHERYIKLENSNLDRSVKGASKFGIDTGYRNYAVVGYINGGFGSSGIEIFPFTDKQKAEQMLLDVFEVPEIFDIGREGDAYYKEFNDGRTALYLMGEVGKNASFYFGRGSEYNKPVGNRFYDKLYYSHELDDDYDVIRFFETEQARDKYIEIDLKYINGLHEDQIKRGQINFKL